ncbi:MAG TPA: DUF3861 domain-containing protein [Oxalicibacterium sp.]|nr:DUF3861 domain-containing protein [Oxalicibacterium sp.]
MSAHTYRVTLEYLGGKHAGSEPHPPVRFEAGNHDDLFNIIARAKSARITDGDEAAALTLGLKLFGEVLLKHRKDPLFADLQPVFREFISTFKQRIRDAHEGNAKPLE